MKKFSQSLIALSAMLAFAVNINAQEIHIKARFFEVPKSTLDTLQKNFEVASDGTEMLTPEQLKGILKGLRSNSGVETFAEPEVVTTSGRRTEMRATTIQTIITNFVYQEPSDEKNGIIPQTENVEFGPVLDVVPAVSSGNQILLNTTARLKTFLGYANPESSAARFATNSAGQQITLPTILPQFEVKQASAKIAVPDGQTFLLFPKSSSEGNQNSADVEQKFVVVMITPTLVDSAGNRIHTDN